MTVSVVQPFDTPMGTPVPEHVFYDQKGGAHTMQVETTVELPGTDADVTFDRDCDANTRSLVFGDETTRVRIVGTPEALANLLNDLRATLIDADTWAANFHEQPHD